MLKAYNNVVRFTPADHERRMASLRQVIARWQAELKAMGGRPRYRRGRPSNLERERVRPWMECHAAISGAKELLRSMERQAATLECDSMAVPA